MGRSFLLDEFCFVNLFFLLKRGETIVGRKLFLRRFFGVLPSEIELRCRFFLTLAAFHGVRPKNLDFLEAFSDDSHIFRLTIGFFFQRIL